MRYSAHFNVGKMELENESDDLPTIKSWVANLLKDYPGPDYVSIWDDQEEKVIYQEPPDVIS